MTDTYTNIGQTHAQTDRQTHAQTDGQTQAQTDGQTHVQTDGQTQTQTDGQTHAQTDGQTYGQTGVFPICPPNFVCGVKQQPTYTKEIIQLQTKHTSI